MRTVMGLLFLLAVPAAATAQGTEAISCRSPHQVAKVLDGHAKAPDGQGWRTSADLSRMHADRFESAYFVRSNVGTSPDQIYCNYLSPLGEVPFIQIKDVPRGTCEATGWDVDQSNWAQTSWSTTNLDKAKLTCTATSG